MPNKQYKIVFLGSTAAGKTSLINKYVHNENPSDHKATVGVDFINKVLQDDNGDPIILQLWDTGGSKRFADFRTSYINGQTAAVIVVDLTNANSLSEAEQFAEEADRYSIEKISKILVATKSDLETKITITVQDLQQFAAQHELIFDENVGLTSAKTGQNVEAFFDSVLKVVHKPEPVAELKIELDDYKKKRKKYCCGMWESSPKPDEQNEPLMDPFNSGKTISANPQKRRCTIL